MARSASLFAPFAAVAALAGAGLSAGAGALPPAAEAALGGGPLALLGGAALLLWRPWAPRPSAPLRLRTRRLPGRAEEEALCFVSAAPGAWYARQGAWSLDLAHGGPADMPWQLDLRHDTGLERPLARAATLDAVIALSRRLVMLEGGAEEAAAARLLNGDLDFLLPLPGGRITALAEGGYALHDAAGCHPLPAPEADFLLCESHGGPPPCP